MDGEVGYNDDIAPLFEESHGIIEYFSNSNNIEMEQEDENV